ncbi:MAG: hypothetical protein AAFR04_15935 [Pseudomonadota bacterium]
MGVFTGRAAPASRAAQQRGCPAAMIAAAGASATRDMFARAHMKKGAADDLEQLYNLAQRRADDDLLDLP